MLLTIDALGEIAPSLSYLLHKHPDKVQSFPLSFGNAHVYYPLVEQDRTRACLLLDVDPVGMVRGAYRESDFMLGHYVNDRPFIASSFMSVAIAQVFSAALAGRCKDHPTLPDQIGTWQVQLDTLAVRCDPVWLHHIFEPLGYQIQTEQVPLDEAFPQWGQSPYTKLTLVKKGTLRELLAHLYVLIPVFDNAKHYFVGNDELDKLLKQGQGWLATHPHKDWVIQRYLRRDSNLVRSALERLNLHEGFSPEDEEYTTDSGTTSAPGDSKPLSPHKADEPTLNSQRYDAVLTQLFKCGARSVLDLGCGEGKFLKRLFAEPHFHRIVGMDVSIRALEIASRRFRMNDWSESRKERLQLLHGSLIYKDKRLNGFDAAAVVEVIEHLEPNRLNALEQVLFLQARPMHVIVTTPNQEYNSVWESLQHGQFRHADHRFEWTRDQFQEWGNRIATTCNYSVEFLGIGPEDNTRGTPTQMAVFHRN
jgi:3' terminal RNA ribose 2'-O-methyltransferase Hen1